MIPTVVLTKTPELVITMKMLGTLMLSLLNAIVSFTLGVGEMRTGTEAKKNVNKDVGIWKLIQEVT